MHNLLKCTWFGCTKIFIMCKMHCYNAHPVVMHPKSVHRGGALWQVILYMPKNRDYPIQMGCWDGRAYHFDLAVFSRIFACLTRMLWTYGHRVLTVRRYSTWIPCDIYRGLRSPILVDELVDSCGFGWWLRLTTSVDEIPKDVLEWEHSSRCALG